MKRAKTSSQKSIGNYRNRVRYMCTAAIIAAMYVALTLLSNVFGLASGVIQCRISEALCVLPAFTSAAIPGVTLGCALANLLTSGNVIDIIFGSLATLVGASGTYLLRKYKWLAPVPTIAANTVIIPFVLKYMFILDESVIFFVVTVFIGELISAGVLGTLLTLSVSRSNIIKKHKR